MCIAPFDIETIDSNLGDKIMQGEWKNVPGNEVSETPFIGWLELHAESIGDNFNRASPSAAKPREKSTLDGVIAPVALVSPKKMAKEREGEENTA